jgi:hypothetical protein
MSRLLLVCFVFAAACVNNGPMSGGDDTPDPPSNISPRAGSWYYAESTAVRSSCKQAVQGEEGEFAITDVTASGFRVLPNDGTSPFTCLLNGADFDCPDRAWDTEDLSGLDATVTVHGTADGTFSSAARGVGQQHATVTCSGSDCSSLGLPCTFDVDFVIAAR